MSFIRVGLNNIGGRGTLVSLQTQYFSEDCWMPLMLRSVSTLAGGNVTCCQACVDSVVVLFLSNSCLPRLQQFFSLTCVGQYLTVRGLKGLLCISPEPPVCSVLSSDTLCHTFSSLWPPQTLDSPNLSETARLFGFPLVMLSPENSIIGSMLGHLQGSAPFVYLFRKYCSVLPFGFPVVQARGEVWHPRLVIESWLEAQVSVFHHLVVLSLPLTFPAYVFYSVIILTP